MYCCDGGFLFMDVHKACIALNHGHNFDPRTEGLIVADYADGGCLFVGVHETCIEIIDIILNRVRISLLHCVLGTVYSARLFEIYIEAAVSSRSVVQRIRLNQSASFAHTAGEGFA